MHAALQQDQTHLLKHIQERSYEQRGPISTGSASLYPLTQPCISAPSTYVSSDSIHTGQPQPQPRRGASSGRQSVDQQSDVDELSTRLSSKIEVQANCYACRYMYSSR